MRNNKRCASTFGVHFHGTVVHFTSPTKMQCNYCNEGTRGLQCVFASKNSAHDHRKYERNVGQTLIAPLDVTTIACYFRLGSLRSQRQWRRWWRCQQQRRVQVKKFTHFPWGFNNGVLNVEWWEQSTVLVVVVIVVTQCAWVDRVRRLRLYRPLFSFFPLNLFNLINVKCEKSWTEKCLLCVPGPNVHLTSFERKFYVNKIIAF